LVYKIIHPFTYTFIATDSIIMVSSCIPLLLKPQTKNTIRKYPIFYLCLDLDLAEDLLSGTLDDTTSDGQVGVLLEVKIDLASSLATFVDTPEIIVSIAFS
jgi:hypothetical protein